MSEENTTYWWNVLSMFYGGALGDALGVPFEFRYSISVSKYNGKLEYKPMMRSRFQGVRYGVVGQVSDDTEMTIALAQSIVNSGGKYNRDEAILQYIEWANSKPMGMGANTRKLFAGIKSKGKRAIATYEKRRIKRFDSSLKDGINPKDAQSNGSLMRCAPLALSPGKNYENVITDVDLTNPNDVNREAGVIYVKLLRELLFGGMSGIDPLGSAKQPEIIKAIRQARNKEVRDVMKIGRGWVAHAFYCAVYCLLNFDNYTEAINWVIRLGGDTDTNAAIAGSIMGAKIGYPFLIDTKLEPNLLIMLQANTKDGDFPRPKKYTPAHFLSISEDLGELSSYISMVNTNTDHVVYYYKRGKTPMWYQKLDDTDKYQAYFILEAPEDPKDKKFALSFWEPARIAIVDVSVDENNLFVVENMRIKPLASQKLIFDIQRNPKLMGVYFDDGTTTDMYLAYRFLARFTEALVNRALDEMNPDVRILDPTNRNYDILYGRDFFLLNK